MIDKDDRMRWTWDPAEHPRVFSALETPQPRLAWFDALEVCASDPVTGKILCVIAAIAIARHATDAAMADHVRHSEAIRLLDLGEAWVDHPDDESFGHVAAFLYGDQIEWTGIVDPLRIAWCAHRVVTATVGNFEAGWALGSVVNEVLTLNLDAKTIAWSALESRSK